MGSQSTGSGSEHPQGQLAEGDGEDGGWDGNIPWPLQTGPAVCRRHHSTAQGLRTGADDLVCRTGGRQDGPCLPGWKGAGRSGFRKVLSRGAEGETRVNLSSVAFYCSPKHVCLT